MWSRSRSQACRSCRDASCHAVAMPAGSFDSGVARLSASGVLSDRAADVPNFARSRPLPTEPGIWSSLDVFCARSSHSAVFGCVSRLFGRSPGSPPRTSASLLRPRASVEFVPCVSRLGSGTPWASARASASCRPSVRPPFAVPRLGRSGWGARPRVRPLARVSSGSGHRAAVRRLCEASREFCAHLAQLTPPPGADAWVHDHARDPSGVFRARCAHLPPLTPPPGAGAGVRDHARGPSGAFRAGCALLPPLAPPSGADSGGACARLSPGAPVWGVAIPFCSGPFSGLWGRCAPPCRPFWGLGGGARGSVTLPSRR